MIATVDKENFVQEIAFEKECTRCHEVKLLSEFHIKANGKYGRQSWCRACVSENDRKATIARRVSLNGAAPVPEIVLAPTQEKTPAAHSSVGEVLAAIQLLLEMSDTDRRVVIAMVQAYDGTK